MPAYERKIVDSSPPVPNVQDAPAPIATNTVNHSEYSNDAIYTKIEGGLFPVDYFVAYVNKHDQSVAPSLGSAPVTEQLLKLSGFELRLQGDLNSSFDANLNIVSCTGSANIPGIITPKTGDLFIGEVDGRQIVFINTSVERLSMVRDSGWNVSFKLHSEATPAVLNAIDLRVQEVLHYQEERLLNNARPFISTEQMELGLKLDDVADALERSYRRLIVDGILPLEHGGLEYIDPGLHSMLADVMGMEGHLDPWIPAQSTTTILDALGRDTSLAEIASGDVGFEIRATRRSKVMGRFSRIVLANIPYTLVTKPVVTPAVVTDPVIVVDVDIHPVHLGGYYIFSEWFYLGNVSRMSLLETMVIKLIQGDDLDLAELQRLARESLSWGLQEKLYYIPILSYLVQAVKGDFTNGGY